MHLGERTRGNRSHAAWPLDSDRPLRPPAAAGTATVAAGRAPVPLTPMPNLILIDDSPDDREWIEGMARGAGGFAVASFASSAEGVAHFREHGADCILLDRRLDGEDGLAVLSRLKMETIFCPVIMLTGDEDVDLPVAAVRSGAARYLPKARLDAATLSGR